MAEAKVTMDKACALTGWTERHVRRTAKGDHWQVEESESPSGNGRLRPLFFVSSLPAKAQRRYYESAAAIVVTPDAILERSNETLPLFAQAPAVTPAQRFLVPEKLRSKVDARYAAIEPMLDFRRRTNGHRPSFQLSNGRVISNLNELAEWQAAQQRPPVSSRAIWRWYVRFTDKENGGYAALADRPRKDKDASRIYGRPPQSLPDDSAGIEKELSKLSPAGKRVAHLYLTERQNIRACHRVILREFQSLGLEAPPSYDTTRSFLEAFPKPFFVLAHGGEKKFQSACAPYVVRDYTTARVLEYWVLDHAQDDFFVRNDYIEQLDRLAFPDLPLDARVRMWFTAFMDIRSRFILGYTFSVHPSSTAICSALRMAVLRMGRAPRYGLLDRGEDMKKMGLMEKDAPLAHAGALARLIKQQWGAEPSGVIFSIGEHPQSKPIESWFKTKRNQFDSLVPSYCGNKPENRPDSCGAMLDAHDAFLACKRASSPLPPASQAVAATVFWVEEAYNQRHRHSGHGMGQRTPEQVLRSQYSESEQATASALIDSRALDEFLRDRQVRKVFSEGCVRLYNAEYEPADDVSRATLRVWNGRDVLVGADPHNLGDAVALDPETGEFLGRLIAKKLLAWGASKDQIRNRMRKQRRFRRSANEYMAGLAGSFAGPAEPFAFLGARQFALTGTDNRSALPPAGPLSKPAPSPQISSPFVDDAAAEFEAAMNEGEKP